MAGTAVVPGVPQQRETAARPVQKINCPDHQIPECRKNHRSNGRKSVVPCQNGWPRLRTRSVAIIFAAMAPTIVAHNPIVTSEGMACPWDRVPGSGSWYPSSTSRGYGDIHLNSSWVLAAYAASCRRPREGALFDASPAGNNTSADTWKRSRNRWIIAILNPVLPLRTSLTRLTVPRSGTRSARVSPC